MSVSHFAAKSRIAVILISALTLGYTTYFAFTSSSLKLTQWHFNAFVLLSATTLIINLALLAYFIRKPARTEERIWLAVYIMALVLFAFSEMMQRLSANPQAALFWSGFSGVSLVAAPVIYLFSLAYTNQSERRYTGTIALLIFSGFVYLFYECFTNIVFINSTKYAVAAPWGFDYRTAIGPASGLLLIWYDVLLGAGLARLISFRRHTRNTILRKQSLLFIFAISIPLVGGSITDLVLPMLGVTSVPSLATTLGTPAAIIIIYGLVRYQLLTVNPTLYANTILSIMQEAVVVTDKAFNIVFVNAKAEELLGVKAEAASKADLVEHIARASVVKFQSTLTESGKAGETKTIDQIDITQPHGGTVPVRLTSTWLALGDYETRVMILTDITKELQVRSVIEHEVQVRTAELNQARAYLVASINSLEQGFILLDPKGRIELANGIASTRMRLASAELVGIDISQAAKALPWDVDLAKTAHTVLESKRARQLKVAATDGTFFVTYVTPILSGARVLGATVVIEDVTEQKILERSKDEFFSIASHELRTPLTAIRGNMSMVKDYFPEAMKDDGLAAMVNDTHDASIRLIAIVNDFLDSSRLEQGKMEFNIQPIALGPIVESVQKDLGVLVDKQKDKLVVEDLSRLPKVMADEGRTRQIVYNLMSNAIKYSTDATITVGGSVEKGTLHLRVADTGKGISPENQKLLFHKFQQAGDPLTRDDTKGTGLGLYISRLLATNMHGDVALERSEVGKGSVFVVTLPLAK